MRSGIACGAVALALVLSGCDGAVFVATPGSPSPKVAASIRPAVVGRGGLNVTTPFAVPFVIVITVQQPIDVHQVTIRLIDGSSLGGPTITFPRAELLNQLGTTSVAAGTTRTWSLAMPVSWPRASCAVSASIVFADARGVQDRVTVEGSWP